jgi:hypothetical protein
MSELSRHLELPQIAHYRAIMRILRYLKGTMDNGITYDDAALGDFHTYCDAS